MVNSSYQQAAAAAEAAGLRVVAAAGLAAYQLPLTNSAITPQSTFPAAAASSYLYDSVTCDACLCWSLLEQSNRGLQVRAPRHGCWTSLVLFYCRMASICPSPVATFSTRLCNVSFKRRACSSILPASAPKWSSPRLEGELSE